MADKTQLEILAEQYRKEVVSKNYYTSNQIYNSNNPNAKMSFAFSPLTNL